MDTDNEELISMLMFCVDRICLLSIVHNVLFAIHLSQ